MKLYGRNFGGPTNVCLINLQRHTDRESNPRIGNLNYCVITLHVTSNPLLIRLNTLLADLV